MNVPHMRIKMVNLISMFVFFSLYFSFLEGSLFGGVGSILGKKQWVSLSTLTT